MIMPNDNELFHWGVLGMRWGVRKQPRNLSEMHRDARRREKLAAKKATKQGKQPKMDDDGENLREVSPKELRKRNKLAKKAGLIEQPKMDDDGERLKIDYEKSKHLKKPEQPDVTKTKNTSKDNKNNKNDKTDESSKEEAPRKKTKEEMTTQELWEAVNRVNAEKKYDETFNPKQPNPEKVRLERVADKAGTTSTALNKAKDGFNSASDVAKTIAAEARKVPSKKVQEELSQMSNKEIQDKIFRIKLEREYASLNPSSQAIAAERTAAVLTGIGHLAAVGGSIASIASSINQYKARRLD